MILTNNFYVDKPLFSRTDVKENIINYDTYKLPGWIYQENQSWYNLSMHKNAIYILQKNPDKINWDLLSRNPMAMYILEQNEDKINYKWLSLNPH
jgi:hypothetical protein